MPEIRRPDGTRASTEIADQVKRRARLAVAENVARTVPVDHQQEAAAELLAMLGLGVPA